MSDKNKSRTEFLTLYDAGQFACAVLELFEGFFLLFGKPCIQFFLLFATQIHTTTLFTSPEFFDIKYKKRRISATLMNSKNPLIILNHRIETEYKSNDDSHNRDNIADDQP